MKKLFLVLMCSLFFFLLKTQVVIGQNSFEISGQVKDAKTKENMEFCTVAIFSLKDSLITGVITDKKGFFIIPVNPGVYNLVFSYIGYKVDSIKNVVVSENKFMGIIKLDEDLKTLKEVDIKTSSRESEIDKDVQIVTESLKAGASNTKDVLDKLNGVDIDRYTNAIKVDNDSKVIILVDGMQKDQEYIKNLSPERLKKIEVIRDPSGRYALEGYSAVINIILKRNYQGTEVFVSERSMLDVDAKKVEYIPIQSELSTTLNYTYNKINLYGKFNNSFNNFNLNSVRKRVYPNGFMVNQIPVDEDNLNTFVKQFSNNFTFGTDYYINPKHTLSLENNLQTQPFNLNHTNVNYNLLATQNDYIVNKYLVENLNQNEALSFYNSLFYEWKINENNTLNSNFTFSKSNDNSITKISERGMFVRNELSDNTDYRTKAFAEFTHIFNPKANILIGYGNSLQDLNNQLSINTPDTSMVSEFNYNDFRNKLYSYFSYKLSKKIGVKFGCALESSTPKAFGTINNYLIYQPHLDLKYNINKFIDLKAKYRAFSNYPSVQQTRPYATMVDLQSYKVGNPHLKPEVTHKTSLQANILGGLATIEPYYHFAQNYITEIGSIKNDSIFEYNLSNGGLYKNYGIEARLAIPLQKFLILQSDFDFFNAEIKYANKTNPVNDWTMSSQLIYINEKLGTVAGLQYQNGLFKSITPQGYNKWNNDFWIVFVQQTFLKKNLTAMLLYFPPIALGVDYMQGSYLKTENYQETVENDIGFLQNIVMLELSYRFNKGKSINIKEKLIELDQQKKNKGLF